MHKLNRLLGGLCALAAAFTGSLHAAEQPPNIVIIFTDDQGYADLGCFGAKGFTTPHLDRMAQEGMRFTNFYVAQAVCSASRAALLTGCYPNRIGIQGALGPNSKIGIHANEITLAELLKPLGYATAIYGKWHLGDHPQFLPTRHGFDEYFGLPYSNDMWPKHPTNKSFPPLKLIQGETIIERDPDQRQLTGWYTERAVQFIAKHKDQPFFLYVPHSMPHVPLFVSSQFRGKSEQGLYGDVIMEIDHSVGRIRKALEQAGVAENTLVVFTSDNGPWLSYGNHAGSAGLLREGKGTTWEGGVREPTVMVWPGTIPPGTVCHEPVMTIDLLPTIAQLTGATLPAHPIDGKNIASLLRRDANARSPHKALYFYWGRELQALRAGKWKLHFPHRYRTLGDTPPGKDGLPARYSQKNTELALFDLDADPGETTNCAEDHPEVVMRLQQLADVARQELGDRAKNRTGSGVRPVGRVSQ